MAELIKKHEQINYDDLIGGISIAPFITIATLKGINKTLKKGTLLALNAEGKYIEVVKAKSTEDSTSIAIAILKEDTELTGSDTNAPIYTKGMFNREKLIVTADTDTVEAHELELREHGIYLTHII